jgi:hypothetical protein
VFVNNDRAFEKDLVVASELFDRVPLFSASILQHSFDWKKTPATGNRPHWSKAAYQR